MYATAINGDGAGHIGSATLPASRPLCIPVRFQPLGGAPSASARWMGGTGALAAAASTLPLPLDDNDDCKPSHSVRYSGNKGDASLQCAGAESAPSVTMTPLGDSDPCTTTTATATLASKSWLWPVVGALVLLLVLLGGGAAWVAWQKRQRACALGGAPEAASADKGSDTLQAIADVPAGTGPVPMSPLPQAPLYPTTSSSVLAAQPLSVPVDPTARPGALPPTHWTHSLAQPVAPAFVGSPAQRPQYADQAATAGQGQARGTYVMVERPPLRIRNATAAARHNNDSGDDDDDEEYNTNKGSDHHQNGRSVAAQSRGVNRNDSWTRRAPPPRQIPASPQESHYGETPAPRVEPSHPSAWARGVGSDTHGRGLAGARAGDVAQGRQHQRHLEHGDSHGDDDSLIDGIADYWADAERARQTYFASPQERAAHAMRLGPHAYSPDGTPMPLRD
nr:DNA translocase ftsk domain [Pandoravirus massiliensis]